MLGETTGTSAGGAAEEGKFLRVPGTIVFEMLPPIPAGLKRAEFMRELQTGVDTASEALLGL